MPESVKPLPAAPACVAILLALGARAAGDAIVVSRAMSASTIAEIFIEDASVRVELEIGAGDLDAFRNLLPDALYERLGRDPKPLAERLPLFFAEDWVIRTHNGPPLPGRLERIDAQRRIRRDEITGEPLPVQPGDAEPVVVVELLYELDGRPAALSIKPPLRKEGDFVAANVGFMAYHGGLPVNDFRYLAREEVLDLDWGDPWFSRFRNKNLKRQFDAPLSAFLYVDFFEVRKEIVLRPKDLQHWTDLRIPQNGVIPVAEQDALKQRVAEFLADRNPVTVDGRTVEGTLDRIHFLRRSLRTTGVVDPPEDLDVTSATLGVIFVYPIEKLPDEVAMTWEMFSPRIQKIPAVATDEVGGMPSVLTADDPVLRWQNFLTSPSTPTMKAVAPPPPPPRITIPVLSTLCFGVLAVSVVVGARKAKAARGIPRAAVVVGFAAAVCGIVCLPYARASFPNPLAEADPMGADEAAVVNQGLLYNVYRAFDRREENVVYDRLALSIAGELLTDVYLQTRRAMELESQGGARVKVDEVNVLETTAEPLPDRPGYASQCRWNVAGSVGHWGHIHRRTNQYDALFTVEPVEGAWKITGMDLQGEKRMDTGPSGQPASRSP
ncbi:MAG: hypothetical protein ACYTG0_18565 [Planctomycetota bacterium]|jgi:hypothetical protein